MSGRTLLIELAIPVALVGAGAVRGQGVTIQPNDTVSTAGMEQTLREIEDLLDNVESGDDNSSEMDRLLDLSENPLDLNTASAQQLESLPGVTESYARMLVHLRETVGGFTSLTQVRLVGPRGDLLIPRLEPFVYLPSTDIERRTRSRRAVRFRSRHSRDLQPRAGYTDGRFAGSSLKSYNRLLVSGAENLQVGILAEKDAGERISDAFLSGFLQVALSPPVLELILGDYTLDAGQGLVFWRGVRANKGSMGPGGSGRNAAGARGYASTDEFNFFRGASVTHVATMSEKSLLTTVIFSNRFLSGTGGGAGRITGFYEEGLFRTENELMKRNAVEEQLVGGRMVLSSRGRWELGVSLYRSRFSRDVVLDAESGVTTKSVSVAGIDGKLGVGLWKSFFEVARSGPSALAWVVGTVVSLDEKGTFSLAYRDYSPRFVNPHAHGFGERDGTRNEQGLFLGVWLQPSESVSVNAYADLFLFPWSASNVPFPVSGRDLLLEAVASCSPSLTVRLRYSTSSVEKRWTSVDAWGRTNTSVRTGTSHKLRFKVRHRTTSRVHLEGGLEGTVTEYDVPGTFERGIAMYQGVRFSTRAWVGEIRMIVFETDSYVSRLYEYENDLVGVFQNYPLYGRGRRWYALARWSPGRGFSLSFKYSETIRDNARTIGSGESEIMGDLDNRLSVQLDLSW